MTDAVHGSPALDPTVPDVARMYDFMLGGKGNYASVREAVARLIAISPCGVASRPGCARPGADPAQRRGDGIARLRPPGLPAAGGDSAFRARGRRPGQIDGSVPGRLTPGSYLIVSHATMDGYPAEAAADNAGRAGRVYDRATTQLSLRDPAEVTRLLAGFELVEPGLVQWRPTEPPRATYDPFLGAVGVRS